MLVKVNTSLAGADFTYNFGVEVDAEEFAAAVGNGWENLCDPIDDPQLVELAVKADPLETAIVAPVETAVVAESPERRGRRK